MELTNILKRFLMNGVPKMVVKLSAEAKKYETLEIMKEADIFVSASLKVDTINAYKYSLDSNTLIHIGIYDRRERQRILLDPTILEREYKAQIPKILEYERKKIINKYIEKNNYYRMLNGQPDIEDDEELYLDAEFLSQYGFTQDPENMTPIHMLPREILLAIEADGHISNLQEQYPQKRYISYVASRRISIVEARQAHNFDLLYFPKQDENNRFYRDFLFYYEEAREYFTSAVYNHNFGVRYPFYDGFIGLMILHMTIQRMISNLFKIVVERDFYDLATIRLFLEAFGVPFIDIFTLQQQRMLVKNLNILLMKKQGTQVMYDILDLLGYDSFELFKYVLVKQHKMIQANVESDYKPQFIYRLIVDEKGNQIVELDNTQMFDYYFVRLDMKDPDIKLEDITADNAYDYMELTGRDPTWIEDDELFAKLEAMDYNFVETKYVDVSVHIRMQEKLFELTYMARLLLDKHEDTSGIRISLARISDNPFSLLEAQVFLTCLMCKNNSMVPNILRTPSKILSVLGFNFHEDLETIKADILKENEEYRYKNGIDLYDLEVLDYIKTVTFKTAKDVNDFYVNIRDFEEFLSYAMLTTKSVDAYHAYRKLYNTLMITYIDDDTYKDRDGNPVYRYDEYLKALNPELYNFWNRLNPEECPDYINYIGVKFATLFEDTKYMGMINIGDATLIEGIIKMIRTFKSLTIDIKDMDVVYVLDSRTRNTMRLFSKVWGMTSTIYANDVMVKYGDYISELHTLLEGCDDMIIREAERCINFISNGKEAFLNLSDELQQLTATYNVYDKIFSLYTDTLDSLECIIERNDSMGLTDKGHCTFIWEGESPRIVGGTPL